MFIFRNLLQCQLLSTNWRHAMVFFFKLLITLLITHSKPNTIQKLFVLQSKETITCTELSLFIGGSYICEGPEFISGVQQWGFFFCAEFIKLVDPEVFPSSKSLLPLDVCDNQFFFFFVLRQHSIYSMVAESWQGPLYLVEEIKINIKFAWLPMSDEEKLKN